MVAEQEPNDAVPGEAPCAGCSPTPFRPGDALEGQVDGGADRDVFATYLAAGAVLEVRAAGSVSVRARAVDRDEPTQTLGDDDRLQLFAPADGEYVLVVEGADAAYRLQTALVEPRALPLPAGEHALVALGGDDVVIFPLSSSVETQAQRLLDAECSHFDPFVARAGPPIERLWLYSLFDRRDVGGWDEVFPEGVDVEGALGDDPASVFGGACFHPYWLVAQARGARDADAFTLEADVATPRLLRPGARLEEQLREAEGAFFGGDAFAVEVGADATLRVVVRATGPGLAPALEAWRGSGLSGGVTRTSAGLAVGEAGVAALAWAGEGRWWVRVDDQRNWPLDDASPAGLGGDDFGYTIEAHVVQPDTRAARFPLDDVLDVGAGETAWYEATLPPDHAVWLEAATAEGTGEVVAEGLYAFFPPAPGAAAQQTLFQVADGPATLRFGVRDGWFRPRRVTVTGRLFDLGLPTRPLVEVEPNDTPDQAPTILPATEVRGTVAGRTQADREVDLFRIELRAGQTVLAWSPAAASHAALPELRFVDAAGGVLADEAVDGGRSDGGGAWVTGRSVAWRAPRDGAAWLEVRPPCGERACVDTTYGVALYVR
ncbi:MAG: hypothetical protein H6706_06440 [Myxococcales bacterium]|nr:hypothetical protein [Myxococcales bacterium]